MNETIQTRKRPREVNEYLTKEGRKIRGMFGQIAPKYDFLNRLLSLNIDQIWRKETVKRSLKSGDCVVVDAACGTGDLAFLLRDSASPKAKIYGVDFTRQMLTVAQKKSMKLKQGITWIEADGLKLPFPDASADLITIGFGIRNMANLPEALQEFRRVLKPGGRLAILEFTPPENLLLKWLFFPYFIHVLPRIAGIFTNWKPYYYLSQSVLEFPNRRKLAQLMRQQGFSRVRHKLMLFGISALHIGEIK